MTPTERPILFNGEMVRAILDGRKTQTRRPIKPQPPVGFDDPRQGHDGQWFVMDGRPSALLASYPLRSPFGKPGDTLWVRETFLDLCPPEDGEPGEAIYREGEKLSRDGSPMWWEEEWTGWRPSIHMPRWASRTTLTVKRVWVGRVQDITDEAVEAEGVRVSHPFGQSFLPDAMRERAWASAWASARSEARRHFASLWDGLYAAKGLGWDVNPWVWACEFEVSE